MSDPNISSGPAVPVIPETQTISIPPTPALSPPPSPTPSSKSMSGSGPAVPVIPETHTISIPPTPALSPPPSPPPSPTPSSKSMSDPSTSSGPAVPVIPETYTISIPPTPTISPPQSPPPSSKSMSDSGLAVPVIPETHTISIPPTPALSPPPSPTPSSKSMSNPSTSSGPAVPVIQETRPLSPPPSSKSMSDSSSSSGPAVPVIQETQALSPPQSPPPSSKSMSDPSSSSGPAVPVIQETQALSPPQSLPPSSKSMSDPSSSSGPAVPVIQETQALSPPQSLPPSSKSMSDPSSSSGHAVPVIPETHTISQPSTPPSQPPQQLDLNSPRLDLLEETSREDYINLGIQLYEAALNGDWQAAKVILLNRPELVHFAITENHETLLHIAASAKSTKAVEFVKHLLDFMQIDVLGLRNKSGDTALSSAAQAGNLEIAKMMVEKNRGLVEIPNEKRQMPLYTAALFGKPEMVRYLYGISNIRGGLWDDDNQGWVLKKCVEGEIFDVAIRIVNEIPGLLDNIMLLCDLLLSLAHNTNAFEEEKPNVVSIINSSLFQVSLRPFLAVFRVNLRSSEKVSKARLLLKTLWEKVGRLPKKKIDEILIGQHANTREKNKEKETEGRPGFEIGETSSKRETKEKKDEKEASSGLLFVATKMGNASFLNELIRLYPDVVWKQDTKGKTIFHLAIKQRKVEIYKLIHEIGSMKDIIIFLDDEEGNNILHMIGKSAKRKLFQDVSGVAFQMQRELLWFQEVEQLILPEYRKRKNNSRKTPHDLFTETHADLLKAAEDWMKTTASQCMVVSTLIATIVFSAAFTPPGGYRQDSGIPFFHKEPAYIIFVISDAVSLISSSTSILMFLSILTSRYAEKDFLVSLPRKLVNGIAALFLSILTMMIAFSASVFVYNNKRGWLPITITILAGIPVILYVLLQSDLFRDVIKSVYGSKNLFKDRRHSLYSLL